MKIIFVVVKNIPYPGGIEKYTEEVGSRLAAKGHEVIVYTMRHFGINNHTFKGMQIKPLWTIKSKFLEKIIAAFIGTIKSCCEKNTSIIHMHAFGPAMFCFLPKLLGKKVVVQGHGIEWKRAKWGYFGRTFLRLSEKLSVAFPHAITVVSKVQQQYLATKYHKKSTYIPTGTSKPNIFLPKLIFKYNLKGNDYILCVARFVREKGIHTLISAYNKINTTFKLIIAGDASNDSAYKEELQALAKNNPNVIFTGNATGQLLAELYSNCYLFVLPSEIEGLPIALLEAMSYGNCCLTSNIPENLEALNNFGYTFNNKDGSDLATKLNILIHDSAKVEAVKKNAQHHALENYSWDTITDNLEVLYKDIINQKT